MPESYTLESETVGALYEQLVHAPVPESDVETVTTLLNDLVADMDAMRRMDVGETNPATVYEVSDA